MTHVKIKHTQIAHHREKIMKRQRGKCPLCTEDLELNLPSLDHDHDTGAIRGVLCRNCNQVEGRVNRWVNRGKRSLTKKEYLTRMIKYWDKHESNQTGLLHPTHGAKKSRRKRKRKTSATSQAGSR